MDKELMKRLRDIVGGHDRTSMEYLSDSKLVEIHQAFKDAGYIQSKGITVFADDRMPVMLSGQEWYERFENNLQNMAQDPRDDKARFTHGTYNKALEAAKRASGLEG